MAWLDKTLKISFSIINSLAALIMLLLLYSSLSRVFQADAKLMTLIFPAFCLCLFSINVISFWKYFGIFPSIIQIIANLILIPAFQIIVALAVPFAIAIVNQMGIVDKNEEVLKVMLISRVTTIILVANSAYILYRVFSTRKQTSQKQ